MITKDKNQSSPNTKSKLLVLGLILILLVGLFGPVSKVQAADTDKDDCGLNLTAIVIPKTVKNWETVVSIEIIFASDYTVGKYCNTKETANITLYMDTGSGGVALRTFQLTLEANDSVGKNRSAFDRENFNFSLRGVGDSPSIAILAQAVVTRQSRFVGRAPVTEYHNSNTVLITKDANTDVDPTIPPAGSGNDNPGGTNPDGTPAGETAKGTEDFFGKCDISINAVLGGCIVKIFYYVFMVLPSYVLYLAAYIFNAMLALTLGTILYNNAFLPEAWRIVRDFSNIFFILVLLYIAIKMILGLGGAEVKKMVVSVIIAALLINFSMFMTQVVIDASNILALIFYNKIQVVSPTAGGNAAGTATTTGTGLSTGDTTSKYVSTTNPKIVGVPEKDIAGAIVSGFNPAKFLNPQNVEDLNKLAVAGPSYWEKVKDIFKNRKGIVSPTSDLELGWATFASMAASGDGKTLPNGIALAIIATACGVYLFAAYAFFIAGFAFIGRLIELWMLIIFSPFAFMSLSIPELKKVKYLGWDSWVDRLLNISFMAPMFMFFLLLISKLVQINIFANLSNPAKDLQLSVPHVLIMLTIPAVIYITLLWKATKFAKEGAGEFGKAIIQYGQAAAAAVGGLALTAASGGAGLAARGALSATGAAARATVGRAGSHIANSQFAKKWESKGWGGEYVRKAASAVGSASFDARGVKIAGKSIGSVTGLNVGEATKKGGFDQRKAAEIENRQKRNSELKVGENEELKQKLNKTEENLQKLLSENAKELEEIDKVIEAKRQAAADAERDLKAGTITPADLAIKNAELESVKQAKKNLRTGVAYSYVNGAGATIAGHATGNMDALENLKKDQKKDIDTENRRRAWAYADTTESTLGQIKSFIFSAGQHSFRGAKEAAHDIRMEAKLPESTGK